MILFASRPLRTYFSESPLGWYLYRWEMATTPAFVESREAASFAFLAAHMAIAAVVVWLVVRPGRWSSQNAGDRPPGASN